MDNKSKIGFMIILLAAIWATLFFIIWPSIQGGSQNYNPTPTVDTPSSSLLEWHRHPSGRTELQVSVPSLFADLSASFEVETRSGDRYRLQIAREPRPLPGLEQAGTNLVFAVRER